MLAPSPKVMGAVKSGIYDKLFPLALKMRKCQTESEERLWQELRNNRTGYKFRRQHIIDRFIVDFYCVEKGLVVEVDGEIHQNQKERDYERDNILNLLGCKILRFTNEQVLSNLMGVVETIKTTLTKPSHKGEGADTIDAQNKYVMSRGRGS